MLVMNNAMKVVFFMTQPNLISYENSSFLSSFNVMNKTL